MWYELEDQGGIKIISKMVLKWKLLEVKFHSITKRDHKFSHFRICKFDDDDDCDDDDDERDIGLSVYVIPPITGILATRPSARAHCSAWHGNQQFMCSRSEIRSLESHWLSLLT